VVVNILLQSIVERMYVLNVAIIKAWQDATVAGALVAKMVEEN